MEKLNLFLIGCILALLSCTSCVTSAHAYEYEVYDDGENVMVVGDTCYVYYKQPTTVFLNTLHVIDGAYVYWHIDHYIPVIFPYWDVWSPHRYFYYESNRWLWRDRYHYNHFEYRRHHHWNDYRRHYNQPHFRNDRPNRYYQRVPTTRRPQPNVQPRTPSNRGFNNGRTRPNGFNGQHNRSTATPTHRGGRH